MKRKFMIFIYGILSLQIFIPLIQLINGTSREMPSSKMGLKFLPESSADFVLTTNFAGLKIPLDLLILSLNILLAINGIVFLVLLVAAIRKKRDRL